MRTPAFTKSVRFRVAIARPWTTAVAAIRLSLIGIAFRLHEDAPAILPTSSPSPHPRADIGDARPQHRTNVPTRFASFLWGGSESRIAVRRVSRDQRRCPAHMREAMPRRADRAPVLSARSKRWRRQETSKRIRRLRVDGHEEVLRGTRKQPIDGTLVLPTCAPDEAVVPAIETLDVELLSRFDGVHLLQVRRQNDLTPGGYGCLHRSKISSYSRPRQVSSARPARLSLFPA